MSKREPHGWHRAHTRDDAWRGWPYYRSRGSRHLASKPPRPIRTIIPGKSVIAYTQSSRAEQLTTPSGFWEESRMNKATFLAVQLNVDDVAASAGLVELLNMHLIFAADVAEAADALVQLASIAKLSSGVEASVELPAVAIERLREALDNLSGYDESWLLALEPSRALFDDIGRRQRKLH